MIARLAALALAAPLTIAAPALADSPAICHPVNGAGSTGYGWNVIAPDRASVHIDEATGAGKHVSHDGRGDVYAVDGACPGPPVERPVEETTDEPSEEPSSTPTTEPTVEPTEEPTEPTETATPIEDPRVLCRPVVGMPLPEECEGSGQWNAHLDNEKQEDAVPTPATKPAPTVVQSCSPTRCVRVERDETGVVVDRRVTTYPANLKETGL